MTKTKSDKKTVKKDWWKGASLKEKLDYIKARKRFTSKKVDQLLSDCCNANLLGKIITVKDHKNGSLDLYVEITVEGKVEAHIFKKVSPIPSNVRSKMSSYIEQPSAPASGKPSILKKEYSEDDFVDGANGVKIHKKFRNLNEQNCEASKVGEFLIKESDLNDDVNKLDASKEEQEKFYWISYERMMEKIQEGDTGAAKDILCQVFKSLNNYRHDFNGAVQRIGDMPQVTKVAPLNRMIQKYLNYADDNKVS